MSNYVILSDTEVPHSKDSEPSDHFQAYSRKLTLLKISYSPLQALR